MENTLETEKIVVELNIDTLIKCAVIAIDAQKDDTREVLHNVFIESNRVWATNGRVAMVYDVETVFPNLPAFPEGYKSINILITKEIFSALKKASKKVSMAQLIAENNKSRLEVNGNSFTIDHSVNGAPDIDQITPAENASESLSSVMVNPELFSLFGEPIEMQFTGKEKVIRVLPLNGNKWYGLLMPLREK